MHRPLFSWFQGDFNPDDARVLHAFSATHGVEAVFSAHDHFFYEERHDGIRYVTVGGAGGPLYTQPPAGGFAHYLLVTVRPGGVEYNVVEPNHIDVDHLAGNDGRAAVRSPGSRTRPTAISWRATSSSGSRRLRGPAAYSVSAIARDFARVELQLPARAVRFECAAGEGQADAGRRGPAPEGMRRVGDRRGLDG